MYTNVVLKSVIPKTLNILDALRFKNETRGLVKNLKTSRGQIKIKAVFSGSTNAIVFGIISPITTWK